MPGRLNGEVSIVTGSGRGFGRAIALAFAAEGSAVGLTARTNDEIESVAKEIKAAGGRAVAVQGDVTRPADIDRLVKMTRDELGPITLLVNNAGHAGPFGPIGHVDPSAWWSSHELHLRAPLLAMSAVLPDMRAARKGRIVNIASLGAYLTSASLSAYSVGKHAMIRLAEHVALETRDEEIAVFSIEPGTVMTHMGEDTLADKDVARWLPGMIGALKSWTAGQDPEVGLARCAERCVQLASGRYDRLSGRYLEPDDDLDALMKEPTVFETWANPHA